MTRVIIGGEHPCPLVFFRSHEDNVPAPAPDMTWGLLKELLSSPRVASCTYANGESRCTGKECPHKLGPAWSPVTYAEGTTRGKKNVLSVSCAVFDLDHVDAEEMRELGARLAGHAYVVHSTHNHRTPTATDPGDICLRLVMPLSRPVAAVDWTCAWHGMIASFGIPGDPACKDPSRLFFAPSARADVPYLFAATEGQAVDVDAALAAGASVRPATPPAPEVELTLDDFTDPEEGQEVDLAAIRTEIKRAIRNKRGIVHPDRRDKANADADTLEKILAGAPIAVPGGRDAALNQAASLLVTAVPNAAADALLEVMRVSIGKMDTSPEGLPSWLENVRDMLVRARGRAEEYRAEREAQAEHQRGLLLSLAPPASAAPEVPSEMLAEDPDAWRALLKVNHSKEGPTIRSCAFNAGLILTYDRHLRGTFKWNELQSRVDVIGGPFADTPRASLSTEVGNWLARHYEQSLPTAVVREQMGLVARKNPYNPVKEYLETLAWDGVPRCDTWLESYCGAVVVDDEGQDISHHVRRIAGRWMISTVARALDPGCQVDTVLVLEGPQGAGKSSAFRMLAGEWFCDTQLVIGDKDSRMLAASNWIIELAELASFKRTETEQQKAFFTAREDKFRPPYGTDVESFKRRCVFVGTTNDASYLVDNTGHRRFWPVTITEIDRVGLKAAKDQLWAEAVARYKAGERWWLEADELDVAAQQAQVRAVMTGADVIEERVREWWYNAAPSMRPDFIRADEIAEKVLGVTPDKMQTGVLREVRVAMTRLGFEYTRRRIGALKDGGRERAYGFMATEGMRAAPQGQRHLRAVTNEIAAAKVPGSKT
jgi:hypothetical protein